MEEEIAIRPSKIEQEGRRRLLKNVKMRVDNSFLSPGARMRGGYGAGGERAFWIAGVGGMGYDDDDLVILVQ